MEFLQRGYIDNLAHCQFPRKPRERVLPSWAVDWSMEIRCPIIGNPLQSIFKASGIKKQDKVVLIPDLKRIILQGVFVDSVECFGTVWDPNWLESLRPDHVLDYLTEIQSFCSISSRIRSHDEKVDCARISIGDRGNCTTPQSQIQLLEAYVAAVKYFNRETSSESTDAKKAATYVNWLGRLHSRRPFISQTGFVGLIPSHAAKGDILCIFLGGKGVYLLRPQPATNHAYTLIGEAYVHGIMYGEFMKSDPKVERFALV
jgi:hypothetical protein